MAAARLPRQDGGGSLQASDLIEAVWAAIQAHPTSAALAVVVCLYHIGILHKTCIACAEHLLLKSAAFFAYSFLQCSNDRADAFQALPETRSLESNLIWDVLTRLSCQKTSKLHLLHGHLRLQGLNLCRACRSSTPRLHALGGPIALFAGCVRLPRPLQNCRPSNCIRASTGATATTTAAAATKMAFGTAATRGHGWRCSCPPSPTRPRCRCGRLWRRLAGR
mmetsp:Transcript_41728/g.73350  ORF Transcript_41728/g.73350 Transcript_41728/m.73350 type:complete len:222 (+) Transcript_41728:1018-1683(+)